MRVIKLDNLAGTERDVQCPQGGFRSLRGILACDGMGFSVHKTIVPPGPPQLWHYKHHKEICYCVSGRGVLIDKESGTEWEITPDYMYILNDHRAHTFQAKDEVVLISVFNPPLTGSETHQLDASYPLLVAGEAQS